MLESVIPPPDRDDGNQQFIREVLPRTLVRGSTIWDVGGGSRPFVSPAQRKALELRVVGLDISAAELDAAPPGSYDEIVVHDLCTYVGREEADHVICTALLEHTPDTVGAMRALATIARKDGNVYIFAPARNALFARLNRLLPERTKRWLLFSLLPEKADGHHGFPAHYDHCTPAEIEELARANCLEVTERLLYWGRGDYFKVFVPAYLFWRAFEWTQRLLAGEQAAESFIYVLRRTA